MKQLYTLFGLFCFLNMSAQVFDKEIIKNSGDNDKRINIVILSEGYQTSELAQFVTDANTLVNDMFSISPLMEYADYFNVHIIKVPSNESGADHPATAIFREPVPADPVVTVDTYFNATFDAFGDHLLLFYELNGQYGNNSELKIDAVLADNFPDYDYAILLVNTPYYGGSGGKFAIAGKKVLNGTIAIYNSRVMVHELGHSLFALKDEYYPGDQLAAEAINMTQTSNQTTIKWKNWLNNNNVGIYPYGISGTPATWFKPHQACMMFRVDYEFCPVCKEGMVEKIHELQSPINDYTPVSSTVTNPSFPLNFNLNLIKPVPTNTLKTNWVLNNVDLATDVDGVEINANQLNSGTNTLTVSVFDDTTLLKVDGHGTSPSTHLYTVIWIIDNTLGIQEITSETANYNITMYPNPTNNVVYFNFESYLDTNLTVEITSLDGKKVNNLVLTNYQSNQLDISHLSSGIYLANFYAKNARIASKKLVVN